MKPRPIDARERHCYDSTYIILLTSYYQLRQLRPLVRSMSAEAVKTLVHAGVHFVSPGLLQLAVLRHRRWSDEPAAVCPECGCTSAVRCTTVRPHHAGATGAALASSSTSGGVQDCHSGLPVTVRHGPSLSGLRLSVGLRRRLPSPAFCHIEDVCCQTDLQQLWRQVLRLQVLDFGTAFQLICDKLTLALNNLNGY